MQSTCVIHFVLIISTKKFGINYILGTENKVLVYVGLKYCIDGLSLTVC